VSAATPPLDDLRPAFEDWGRLRALHRLVAAGRPEAEPTLALLLAERLEGVSSLAVLAGSFNPLTTAHLALAEAAERAALGPTLYLLSTLTVDKERPVGATLEDRLLVLELHARRAAGRAVGLVNRGLYVEQASLLRQQLPSQTELVFLVGFDKIVQIFDPRYYQDRRAALDTLFGLVRFAVAPRAGAGRAELRELLARAENRGYAERVAYLPLPRRQATVASSRARAALEAGQPLPAELAPEARAFVAATGCYRRGAAAAVYQERAERISRL
jgi:nicotinic acid mononucleotide adenylyltransferase